MLRLENHPSPPPPNRSEIGSQEHLVAYSTDSVYIAMARRGSHVVTVLDVLSGTSQQLIDADIDILDIKITNGTVFAVGVLKLVG